MKWVALLLKRVTPPVKKVFVNFLAEICEYLLLLGDVASLWFALPEKSYSVSPLCSPHANPRPCVRTAGDLLIFFLAVFLLRGLLGGDGYFYFLDPLLVYREHLEVEPPAVDFFVRLGYSVEIFHNEAAY